MSACLEAAPPLSFASGPTGPASTGDNRPENPAQGLEKIKSAPGITTAPETSDLAAHATLLQDAPPFAAPRQEGGEATPAASAGDERPGIPPEAIEKVKSAPGITTAPETSDLAAHATLLQYAPPFAAPRQEGGEATPAASAGDERPQNPAQDLEKVKSAPGITTGPGTSDLAAHATLLQDAPPFAAPRQEGAEATPAASAGDERPQNPAQDPEKVESRARDPDGPGNL